MSEAPRKNMKTQFALALAQGASAAKGAHPNDVTKMTAYKWAKGPVVALRGPAGQAGPRAENRECGETEIISDYSSVTP